MFVFILEDQNTVWKILFNSIKFSFSLTKLWKMRFQKCEFCEKWDFKKVNFVKIGIFMIFQKSRVFHKNFFKIRLNSIKFSFSFTKLSATRRPLAIMESGRPAILAALNPWDLLQGPAETVYMNTTSSSSSYRASKILVLVMQ